MAEETPVYRAIAVDHDGFVITDLDECIAHVQEHLADDDDDGCDECPREISVRTGSALPSEPDADGLNSRVPSSWHSGDLILETDVSMDEWPEVLDRLRGLKVLDAALKAAGASTP